MPASFATQRVDGDHARAPDSVRLARQDGRHAHAAQRDAVAALREQGGRRDARDLGPPLRHAANDPQRQGLPQRPVGGSAVDVARAWVNDNRAAFGLSAADVQALAVTRDHALPGTGTHVVDLQQVVAGVQTVAGGRLIVAVTGNGRVLSYAGDAARSPGGLDGAYALTPAQALAKVAGALAPGRGVHAEPDLGRKAGYDVFARGPFAAVQRVGKAAFLQAGGARPAYRVLFVAQARPGLRRRRRRRQRARCSLAARWSRTTPRAASTRTSPARPQGGTPVIKSFGPTPESPGG